MTDHSRRVTTTPFRSTMAVRSALLVAALLTAPRQVHAQLADSVRIAAGARVWVRMRDGTQREWRFERATPDSLTLRRRSRGNDEVLSVTWNEAERVDTMVVGPASARRMLVGGASGGLLALLVVWFGAGVSASGHAHGECPGCGFILAVPEIVYAGIFTGATLGYFQRDRHWSTAWRAPEASTPPGR